MLFLYIDILGVFYRGGWGGWGGGGGADRWSQVYTLSAAAHRAGCLAWRGAYWMMKRAITSCHHWWLLLLLMLLRRSLQRRPQSLIDHLTVQTTGPHRLFCHVGICRFHDGSWRSVHGPGRGEVLGHGLWSCRLVEYFGWRVTWGNWLHVHHLLNLISQAKCKVRCSYGRTRVHQDRRLQGLLYEICIWPDWWILHDVQVARPADCDFWVDYVSGWQTIILGEGTHFSSGGGGWGCGGGDGASNDGVGICGWGDGCHCLRGMFRGYDLHRSSLLLLVLHFHILFDLGKALFGRDGLL